jgi:hypothetical protein
MALRELARRHQVALACAALLAGSWLVRPWAFDGPVLCPTRLLFGVPCPGCGLTRAFSCLWTGDVGAAVRLHPFAPALFAALVLGAAWPFVCGRLERFLPPLRQPLLAWGLVAELAGWHAWRLFHP